MAGYRSHIGFWFGGLNAIPETGVFDGDCPAPTAVAWAACATVTTTFTVATAPTTSWSQG